MVGMAHRNGLCFNLKLKCQKLKSVKQANAIEILSKIVQQRNWHKGLLERQVATNIKARIAEGKVSYEKACEVLNLLGYQKIQEEVWEIKNDS